MIQEPTWQEGTQQLLGLLGLHTQEVQAKEVMLPRLHLGRTLQEADLTVQEVALPLQKLGPPLQEVVVAFQEVGLPLQEVHPTAPQSPAASQETTQHPRELLAAPWEVTVP